MSRQEFMCFLWYQLGIPMFTSISVSCFCGRLTDQFGNHLVGCGHGSMGIHRHDALCDVIYHALLQDNSGCRREQHHGPCLDHPGDVYHPDFTCGKPAYFDVTVCSSLQDSLLSQSAVSAGVTASRGELEKDAPQEARCMGLVEFLSLWHWGHWVFGPQLV